MRMPQTDGQLSPKDLFYAALAAVVGAVVFGTLASPLVITGPHVFLLALPIVPVAVLLTAIATPLALACVRIGFAGLPYALIAGIGLGWLGAFLGAWFWDCNTDICYLGRCSNHPNPGGAIYGVPFGVMASVAFWAVLRQRSPGAFRATARLKGDVVRTIFLLVWVASAIFSWMGVRLGFGYSPSWCP